MHQHAPLEPGILIHERYRIVGLIGQGGMGAVYQAIDTRLEHFVALKQMHTRDATISAAARREAQMLTRLRHPALPKVTDYFDDTYGILLVMEFIDGTDLATCLAQQAAPLPFETVLIWADQLLQVLDYLHTHDPPILHRDIKPQNLKLTLASQLFLLDFGVARALAQERTAAMTVAGTPQYAPPEQLEGRGLDPRSDLYALAATLYHLVTATPPPTVIERLSSQMHGQPDPLRPAHTLNPAIPPAVSNLLQRALALDITARPESAALMRAEVQQIMVNPGATVSNAVWARLMRYLFLSYARKNGDYARDLHDRLEAEDLEVWWDQENPPGEDWTEQLATWLRDANAMIVLVSRHSVGSDWVKSEVLTAMDFEQLIIPVWLDPSQVLREQPQFGLYIPIRSLQRVAAWDGRDPLPDILRVLRRHSRRSGATTGSPRDAGPDQMPDPPDDDDDDADPFAMTEIPAPRDPPAPSEQQARVTLVRPGEVADFDAREQEGFLRLVARVARIARDRVRIIRIQAGSVHVTLELPESTARWLHEAHRRNDEVAQLLDIAEVRDLEVIRAAGAAAQPGPLTRFQAWLRQALQPPSVRLVGAGALLAVLLVALLFAGVIPGRPTGMTSIALCADLTLTGTTCPQGEPVAFFTDPELSVTLSGAEETIPRVIVPRRSALLALTPTVRWTALPNTQSYTVTLSSAGGTLWSGVVTGTSELAYPPAGAPPLERGQSYRFAVTTATAGPEDAPRLGFNVLSAEAAQAIEAEAQAIRDQGLAPETTAVLLANLYARNELFAEALLQLDNLAAPTTQPAVELLRGNLYVSIGLFDLAHAPYAQALALAEQADNPLAQALAHARLGRVEALLNNTAAARTHYEHAIALFRELRADTQVEALLEELERLPE